MENIEDICLNSSISSWIIDYYFTNVYSNQVICIGIYDMFRIFQMIDSSLSSEEFFNLCKKKLKQIEKDFFIEKYNKYLNQYGLVDIIDIFHQCQLDSFNKTIVLSNKNIQNQMDRLFAEYFMELSSIKTENLLQITEQKEISTEQINNKNHLKHTFCTYLSLLLDTRNEYAFVHCLSKSSGIGNKQDLQKISSENVISNDFIEQLRMIIEENKHLKIESSITFRKLLELIFQQLSKNNQYDLILKETIEEFYQYFQITIESASSQATLANCRFYRSIAYLCAKQMIDLPVLLPNCSKLIDQSKKSVVIARPKAIKKYRSLDLSIIHETSFEKDYSSKPPVQSMVKRQPLREIDINSFNNEERDIKNEKISDQNLIEFTLISDGDKENLPIIRKKRSILSTKNDPPSKKHKNIDVKPSDVGQKMITSFFQSTN